MSVHLRSQVDYQPDLALRLLYDNCTYTSVEIQNIPILEYTLNVMKSYIPGLGIQGWRLSTYELIPPLSVEVFPRLPRAIVSRCSTAEFNESPLTVAYFLTSPHVTRFIVIRVFMLN